MSSAGRSAILGGVLGELFPLAGSVSRLLRALLRPVGEAVVLRERAHRRLELVRLLIDGRGKLLDLEAEILTAQRRRPILPSRGGPSSRRSAGRRTATRRKRAIPSADRARRRYDRATSRELCSPREPAAMGHPRAMRHNRVIGENSRPQYVSCPVMPLICAAQSDVGHLRRLDRNKVTSFISRDRSAVRLDTSLELLLERGSENRIAGRSRHGGRNRRLDLSQAGRAHADLWPTAATWDC